MTVALWHSFEFLRIRPPFCRFGWRWPCQSRSISLAKSFLGSDGAPRTGAESEAHAISIWQQDVFQPQKARRCSDYARIHEWGPWGPWGRGTFELWRTLRVSTGGDAVKNLDELVSVSSDLKVRKRVRENMRELQTDAGSNSSTGSVPFSSWRQIAVRHAQVVEPPHRHKDLADDGQHHSLAPVTTCYNCLFAQRVTAINCNSISLYLILSCHKVSSFLSLSARVSCTLHLTCRSRFWILKQSG